MANDDSQLQLIDTDHESAKPLRVAIRAYNKEIREKNEAKQRADKKRESILEIIKGMGIKPDADGVINFRLGKKIIRVAPGKSQLNITEEGAEADQGGDEEDEGDGVAGRVGGREPELQKRGAK